MRLHTAPLTLTASLTLVLAGAFGHSASLRAAPLTIRMVDSAEISTAVDQWPLNADRQSPTATDHGQPAPGTLARDRQPATAPAPADGASTSSAASTATDLLKENGDWEHQLKDAIRPLYDELAEAGVVDAVSSLKSSLGQIAGAASDAASATGYEVARDAAAGAHDAHNTLRSETQIENEKRLTALMLEELLAAIKPWLLSALALYLLWYVTRLTLDYSRWKSRRAQKHGTKKSRRPRHRARSTGPARVGRSPPP